MKGFYLIFSLCFLVLSVHAQEQQSDSQTVTKEAKSQDTSPIRVKYIKHPDAKEGLYLIDEDGVYHYRTETVSKKDNAMFVRIISLSAPNIVGRTETQTFTFQDMYHKSELTGLDFVYEWQALKGFGK